MDFPDVYVGGKGGVQEDDQLVYPGTNTPIPFGSKREKAAVMKKLELKQSILAERQKGVLNQDYLKRRSYSLPT